MLRLVLCFLAASLTSSSHVPARFLLSEYYSLNHTTKFAIGDFNNASVLKDAISARSYKNEVIVLSFNDEALDLQFHMARQLQLHAGYDHFIIVSTHAESCFKFKEYWGATDRWPGCGFVTLAGDDDPRNGHRDVYRLWLRRYKLVALLLESGLNVLLLDDDVMVHRDVYHDLKRTSLAPFNLYLMSAEVNGGCFYVQNVDRNGTLVWIFHEIVRRGTMIYDYMLATGDKLAQACTPMDQYWLAAMLTVVSNELNPYTWPCLPSNASALWNDLTPVGTHVPLIIDDKDRNLNIKTRDFLLESLAMTPAKMHLCQTNTLECERLLNFHFIKQADMVHGADLKNPFNASMKRETVIRAPSFLFSTWESTLSGFDDANVPYAAIVHLVAFGGSFNRPVTYGSRNVRWWTIQTHGLWFGRQANGFTQEKMLPHSKDRYMGLKAALVKQLVNITETEYKTLIMRLATAASDEKRIPVIPALPCEAAWISKASSTRYGVDELRFRAAYNGMCYPLPDSNTDCNPRTYAMPQALLDGTAIYNSGAKELHKDQIGGAVDVVWLESIEDLPKASVLSAFCQACAGYCVK